MSRDEKGDEMRNRLSQRFNEGDDRDNTDKPDSTESPDNTDNLDKPDNTDDPENGDHVDKTDTADEIDPKEDWTGRNIYVPDGTTDHPDLLDGFDGEYQRLDYECDWEVRKQLHYYPVLVEKGIEQLKEMDGDEFTACVDDLQLR